MSIQNEEDFATQRERELQAKRQLEEALRSKEADHKREIERISVENAFKVSLRPEIPPAQLSRRR